MGFQAGSDIGLTGKKIRDAATRATSPSKRQSSITSFSEKYLAVRSLRKVCERAPGTAISSDTEIFFYNFRKGREGDHAEAGFDKIATDKNSDRHNGNHGMNQRVDTKNDGESACNQAQNPTPAYSFDLEGCIENGSTMDNKPDRDKDQHGSIKGRPDIGPGETENTESNRKNTENNLDG